MKDYVLSAKAILYAARMAGAMSFTGLPNALFGLDKPAEAKAVQEAEDELTKAGLMVLDFDGKSAVEEELAEMARICSNVSQITGYDVKRPDGSSETATVFLDRNENRYLLTSMGQEEGKYLFGKKSLEEIREYLKKSICIPEGVAEAKEQVVESKLLSDPKKEDLVEAGLGIEYAELIEKSINGGAYAMTARRNINYVEQSTKLYLWNDALVLKMDVVYEDDKENIHFKSEDKNEAYDSLLELLDTYEYPEQEVDESIWSDGEDE